MLGVGIMWMKGVETHKPVADLLSCSRQCGYSECRGGYLGRYPPETDRFSSDMFVKMHLIDILTNLVGNQVPDVLSLGYTIPDIGGRDME